MTDRFDPTKNLELVALRSAWRDVGPDADDKPEPSHVRALSALEVLDVLIRDVRGTVE